MPLYYDNWGVYLRDNKSSKEKLNCHAMENVLFLAAVDDRVTCQKILNTLSLSSSVLDSQMADLAQELGIPGTVLYWENIRGETLNANTPKAGERW